jgi:acetyltransferase-like isoleucine patch superfamily enzyme
VVSAARPTPAPSDLPSFVVEGRRASPRVRLRVLRLRLRWRGRIELAKGVGVGRGVRVRLGRDGRLVLGAGAWLGDRCTVVAEGEILIGAGSLVGPESVLNAAESISIGERCLLGDEVMVSDRALTVEDALSDERPVEVRPVVVEDGARVGPRACLLAGSRVSAGEVVGPREVVVGAVERRQ